MVGTWIITDTEAALRRWLFKGSKLAAELPPIRGKLVCIGRLVDPGLLHDDHELLEVDLFALVPEVWARVANLEHQLQLIVPNLVELLLVLVIISQLGGDIVLHRLQIIEANRASIVIIVHLEGLEKLVLHVSLVCL